MRIRRTLLAASLFALIATPLILTACGGGSTPTAATEVLRIAVPVSERQATWEGTLEAGTYHLWLHYRGSYSEDARVCFMIKASGDQLKEQEVKGWMADALRQKEGRFLASEPGRSAGFERPLGKELKVSATTPARLEALIFLGPGMQVRMEQVVLILKK